MIEQDYELKELNKYFPQLLKIDLYRNRHFECCPHCGSIHFIRNGHYRGIQRYKCHECKKTFSQTTNSVWYYSKKKANEWIHFAELFLEKQSLRYCAEALEINLSTAFYWRHKVMSALKSKIITKVKTDKIKRTDIEAVKKINNNNIGKIEMDIVNPEKLRGDVFLTYTYFQENSHNSTINFKMDFYHKEKRIYVVAARGEDDSMMIIPICRDMVRLDEFKSKVYKKIDKKSYIVLYKADHFDNIAKNHNKRLSRRTRKDDSRIKEFAINISEWLNQFHGIATKYLESYMKYFVLYNIDRYFNSLGITRYLIGKLDFIKSHKIKFMEISI
ncbi:MAG: hypothetical protein Q4F66_01650 [Clostridium sp.]|nr:hypothetical protein [Clostridium sp.]